MRSIQKLSNKLNQSRRINKKLELLCVKDLISISCTDLLYQFIRERLSHVCQVTIDTDSGSAQVLQQQHANCECK
jgi:hypothetical protein